MRDALTTDWGVPAFGTVGDLLRYERPDYIAAAVPWAAMPDAIREVVGHRMPVLAEIPSAPDLTGLRTLWTDVGGTGLVQVAEQYLLMPGHAARLALVGEGDVGAGLLDPPVPRGVVDPGSARRGASTPQRSGPTRSRRPLPTRSASTDGPVTTPQQLTTTIATIAFGGKMGVYDFTDNQWWNPLLSRRIVIRGSIGELVDDRVIRLVDPSTPVESLLIRRQTGMDLNLEMLDLKHISYHDQGHGGRPSQRC